MYGIGNVEKFLQDNASSISPQRRGAILRRARKQAEPDGVLMGGMAKDVWRDPDLLKQFGKVITSNVEHMNIGVAAIQGRQQT